jgi:hypothetical protein
VGFDPFSQPFPAVPVISRSVPSQGCFCQTLFTSITFIGVDRHFKYRKLDVLVNLSQTIVTMDASKISRSALLLAVYLPFAALADSSTSTTGQAAATTTSAPFPSMTAVDGLGVSAGGVGSQVDSTAAGASGPTTSTFNLSTGATIAIALTIGIVVIGIGTFVPSFAARGTTLLDTITYHRTATMWGLWFVAKRRQWTIRQTLKHASTRVVTAMTPRTPRARPPPKDPETGIRAFMPGKSNKTKPQEGWLSDEKDAPKPVVKKFGFSRS